jgi:hypothetical protein
MVWGREDRTNRRVRERGESGSCSNKSVALGKKIKRKVLTESSALLHNRTN